MTVDPDIYRKNLLTYTRIAFRLLPEMDCPLILDIGCGTGVPTIELAEMSNGSVTGVDVDRKALDILEAKIRQKKLTDRVRTLRCSFKDMPFEDGTFDIIWAEGSVSQCGFASAVKLFGSCTVSSSFPKGCGGMNSIGPLKQNWPRPPRRNHPSILAV